MRPGKSLKPSDAGGGQAFIQFAQPLDSPDIHPEASVNLPAHQPCRHRIAKQRGKGKFSRLASREQLWPVHPNAAEGEFGTAPGRHPIALQSEIALRVMERVVDKH